LPKPLRNGRYQAKRLRSNLLRPTWQENPLSLNCDALRGISCGHAGAALPAYFLSWQPPM
jgi:hypothetical protein